MPQAEHAAGGQSPSTRARSLARQLESALGEMEAEARVGEDDDLDPGLTISLRTTGAEITRARAWTDDIIFLCERVGAQHRLVEVLREQRAKHAAREARQRGTEPEERPKMTREERRRRRQEQAG